jgi:putative transposase
MPWSETTCMSERARFVRLWSTEQYTMTELCAQFGISRKTGYKWAGRWVTEGPPGLVDRSRAPHSCPHRTEARCEQELVAQRQRHPRWGARKLLEVVSAAHPDWGWPAASTATELLKRRGLVEAQRRRPRYGPAAPPVAEAEAPNRLWTADFKGEFRTGDRRLVYPLTVMDRFSRYLLGCTSRTSTALDPAREVFTHLFREFGLPDRILTDGGTPFSSPRSPRRLSRLAVWWLELGIEPVVIQPGCPQQNGSHERMHKDLKAETTRPPEARFEAQQARFDSFRSEYNEQRPHEGLGMKRPAQLYQTSVRPFPDKNEEPVYPGHFELRRVRSSGEIKWRGQHQFLSEVLAGKLVGLEEVEDGLWSMHFGKALLGRFETRSGHMSFL